MAKIKFKSDILKYSNKFNFYIFFITFVSIFFFIYIKRSRNLSAKYNQENKERLQKRLVKAIKIVLKKKKEKSGNMVVKV